MLLDANMSRDHLAMIGTHITLSAVIKGMPIPTVSWKKDGADVPAHCVIEVTPSGSKLHIKKSTRADCGNYTITVQNAAGSKSATCTVLVLGMQSLYIHTVYQSNVYTRLLIQWFFFFICIN